MFNKYSLSYFNNFKLDLLKQYKMLKYIAFLFKLIKAHLKTYLYLPSQRALCFV